MHTNLCSLLGVSSVNIFRSGNRLRYVPTVTVSARICLILADVIVIVATWVKMHRQVRDTMQLQLRTNTSCVMLTDGEHALPSTLFFPQRNPGSGTLYFV